MVRKLWSSKHAFIDPGAIMGVVVALIVLAIGVFAFFVTIDGISSTLNDTNNEKLEQVFGNISDTGDSVFNIIGIVLIIGAIMVVVGMVYNFISVSDYDSHTSSRTKSNRQRQKPSSLTYNNYRARHIRANQRIEDITQRKHTTRREIDRLAVPNEIGDYELASVDTLERITEKADDYKNNGYWTKLKKLDNKSYELYISKWTKDFTKEYGKPRFK